MSILDDLQAAASGQAPAAPMQQPAPAEQQPVAPPEPDPAAQPPPQQPAPAQPPAQGNPLDALLGPGAQPSAAPAGPTGADRPYWDRTSDWWGDTSDIFSEGVKAVTGAPAQIAGTAEKNHFDDLVPKMMEMGMSEKDAKDMARKLQVNEGVMNIPMGAMQALFSPIFGAFRSMGSRPIEEHTGFPKEGSELLFGVAASRPRISKGKPNSPLAETLRESSNERYTVANSLPIKFDPTMMEHLKEHLQLGLEQKKFLEPSARGTYELVEYLTKPRRSGGLRDSVADIDVVRSSLGRLSRETDNFGHRTSNATAAGQAVRLIDDFMAQLPSQPHYVTQGAHLLPALANELKGARADWVAYLRADLLEDMMRVVKLEAKSTGGGKNIENKIRQGAVKILKNPKKERLYNDAEISMLEELAHGTVARNMARDVGKTAPSGIISGTLGPALGEMMLGKAGKYILPGAGYISKKLADRAAEKGAQSIRDKTAERSPLYEEWARNSGVVPKANLKWLLGTPRKEEEE